MEAEKTNEQWHSLSASRGLNDSQSCFVSGGGGGGVVDERKKEVEKTKEQWHSFSAFGRASQTPTALVRITLENFVVNTLTDALAY